VKVARVNANELEDKTGAFVDGLGVLSLIAAIDFAIITLADFVVSTVSTVFVATRSGGGEEEEGRGGGDREDARKHGVWMKVGW
jgi:hypothetical protein